MNEKIPHASGAMLWSCGICGHAKVRVKKTNHKKPTNSSLCQKWRTSRS